ncbi:ATP-binding protein [Corallococcus carmarthensis]|uniref:histidine kinase n=1 Tax=Corallococcus carmarthensis TaxID=2316728 RepID=A0A3A8JVD3_9BACT|nr:HAMP domain-containing sensor histidine kinase [Corallococcus carmarthensis]RKG94321.1 sensor histidine kinase [Corallococcus carmarthensis]
MSEHPPPAMPEQIAQRVLSDASNDGEALVSAVRMVFCGLVLTRFLLLGGLHAEGGVPAALVELPVLGFAIGASAVARWAARRRLFGTGLLVASSVLDAVFAHASLLSTLVWHGPHYTGLLRMPDPSAAVAVVFITALRLSPRAAWAGTAANLLLMGGLVALDFQWNARFVTYGMSEVALLLIFIGSVGAVASLACDVARRMVLKAGCESARVERTRRHLDLMLREHHDVRTLLSSARLRADLLVRDPGSDACSRYAQALVQDLRELGDFVSSVKSRTLGELAMIDEAELVDVGATLHHAADVVRSRFSHVHIVVGTDAPDTSGVQAPRARIVGGERGLSHVVTNLLVNACEGDGQRGARTVRVSVEPDGNPLLIRLCVSDDGPGFRAGLLEGTRPWGGTTKRDGSGLGMLLVGGLVEASGGSLLASSPPGGGARVDVLLPSGA